jgi:sugar phosphate isomerase/epimerase
MLQRRKFITQSAAALLSTALISKKAEAFFSQKVMPPVGLQLFTFFNTIDNDVPGTLQKISDIGYKEIESAFSKKGGYYGLKPKEFAALVQDKGMSWKSHHVLGAPFKMPPGAKMPTAADGKPITLPVVLNLRDNMQQIVDDIAEAGIPYLVCANTPTATLDEIKSSIDVLNKTNEACKKANITFAYHNHDMEFKTVDGKIPYDLLLSETALQMELDLAWVTKAGLDPVKLFNEHKGRFELWHVKDIDKDFKGPQPVGTGIVDFKRIFANASTAGMKHFFVEHDMPADAYASITTSMQNLKKILNS